MSFCIFAKIMIVLTSTFFIDRPLENLNWVIGILMAVLLTLVISRLVFTSNYYGLKDMDTFVNVNDNQFLFSFINQVLYGVLVGALVVPYLTEDFDFLFPKPIHKAMGVGALVLLFFWVKYLFTLLGDFAFKANQDISLMSRVSSYYRSYSVGVLWLAVMLFYFTSLPKIPILICTLLILLVLRGLQLRLRIKIQPEQNSGNWYYNILYLCALEILPLLVLYKFLSIW